MTISTINLPFKRFLSLACISILLIITLADDVTATPPSSSPPTVGPFRRSYVFMTATNKRSGQVSQSCVNYQQFQSKKTPKTLVSERLEDAKPFILKFWRGLQMNTHLCPVPPSLGPEEEYFGSIVPLDYRIYDDGTDCTRGFSMNEASQHTVNVLKDHNAAAALLIVDRGVQFAAGWKDYLFNEFYDPYINATSIPTFFIYRKDLVDKIMPITTKDDIADEDIEIRFHRPSGGPFDKSMIVIWIIAMTCVTGGGLWAHQRNRLGKDVPSNISTYQADDDVSEASGESGCCKRMMINHGNFISIFLMMVCLCAVLLLGYFFRPVLVYIFNILLVLFGSSSIYTCIRALLSNFPFSEHGWYRAKIHCVPTLFGREEKYAYTEAIICLLSISFCVTWFFERLQQNGCILLDIINIAVCLNVLKSSRLPSLKWLTIMMACMFVYDAFMVFGTGYFTKNSCSIMLEVATGITNCTKSVPKEGEIPGFPVPPIEQTVPEKFPMLMQVPHLNPMNECMDMEVELTYPVAILGLGDIVLPGYLIAHCFTMNGFSDPVRLLYGFVSLMGYAIGLIVTFSALVMFEAAQPALIYLVPFTLLPILAVAVCRREFRKTWDGCPRELSILHNNPSPDRRSKGDENEEDKKVGVVVFKNAEESSSTTTAISGESNSENDPAIV